MGIGGFFGYVFFQTFKKLDNLKIDVLKWVDDLSKATGASLDEIITAFFFKKSGAPASPIQKVVLFFLES